MHGTLSEEELDKIVDFILTSPRIILKTNGKLFSRALIVRLRDIVKGNKSNDFILSLDQEKALIDAFLAGNKGFTNWTPDLIKNNPECIKVALENDINSACYMHLNEQLKRDVIKLALKKKYVIDANSPRFLKENYDVALQSIYVDHESIDNIPLDEYLGNDRKNLIRAAIQGGYVLHYRSPEEICNSVEATLASIKQDISTLDFATKSVKCSPEILNYLIENKEYNHLTYDNVDYVPVNTLAYPNILKFILEKKGILTNGVLSDGDSYDSIRINYDERERRLFADRYVELFSKVIAKTPTIADLQNFLEYFAQTSWEDYRASNADQYTNIFGKIIATIQDSDSSRLCVHMLSDLLDNMKDLVGKRYDELLVAIEKCYDIIHGETVSEELDKYRDIIASISALYLAKCKEDYKKEEKEKYIRMYKPFFEPRIDHPVVKKKITEYLQKNQLIKLYLSEDPEILELVSQIRSKFADKVSDEDFELMIKNFLSSSCSYSKLDKFLRAPFGFNKYKKSIEAKKLVNRLNQHYIDYDSNELTNYKSIIEFDDNNNRYIYTGPTFEKGEIERFEKYREKQRIFKQIKQILMEKARTFAVSMDYSDDLLDELADDLPFNDEYMQFSKRLSNEEFTFREFLDNVLVITDNVYDSFVDDDSYKELCKLFDTYPLAWIMLMQDYRDVDLEFDRDDYKRIVTQMSALLRMAQGFGYEVQDFGEYRLLSEISESADNETLALLGPEIIKALAHYKEYTSYDVTKILNMASEMVSRMVLRNKSTVPFVEGQTQNYKYSLYDSQDISILLAGINTDACFRIDGNDNDFLHYCALDKNGFVIKITDMKGNFMARASGFRNGNCIFINQLRTVYDAGGNCYQGAYEAEKSQIIETFTKACEDIIKVSHSNKNEKNKIDYVFVTQSYSMQHVDSNVTSVVYNEIGRYPMSMGNKDWRNFVDNTPNLDHCGYDRGFTTDYGGYYLICVAHITGENTEDFQLEPTNIRKKDVSACYTRRRNPIMVINNLTDDVVSRINRIKAIHTHINNLYFEPFIAKPGMTAFIGDNWYIVCLGKTIYDSCVELKDKQAQREFNATKDTISKLTVENAEAKEEVTKNCDSNADIQYVKTLGGLG